MHHLWAFSPKKIRIPLTTHACSDALVEKSWNWVGIFLWEPGIMVLAYRAIGNMDGNV